MSDAVRINTTQNVGLNFEVASLGDRLAAHVIDQCILWGYEILVNFLRAKHIIPSAPTITIPLIILVPGLYHLLFEVFNNGRSVGKMVMKTRVIRLDGTEPRLSDFIIRWLIGLFEVVATQGGIAMVAFLFNGKGQRLGDIAAGTTVAKLKKRVTLRETIYTEVKEDYTPTYPEAENLTDLDVQTIKEVMITLMKSSNIETLSLLEQTKKIVEKKLNIKSMEKSSGIFLNRIIKDYNYITGRAE